MNKVLIVSMTAVLMVSLGMPVQAGGRQETPPMMEGSMAMAMEEPKPVAPPGSAEGEYRKPSKEELKERLSPLSYEVTQRDGTEPSFNNPYWDLHEEGIFVDIVSGEPLFSSRDKYDSRTGWPSFTRPLEPGNVVSLTDSSFGMIRTEVRSLFADSHLGHVFSDGPAPTGLRYCINSASLRFVPVEELESEGYGRYLPSFGENRDKE